MLGEICGGGGGGGGNGPPNKMATWRSNFQNNIYRVVGYNSPSVDIFTCEGFPGKNVF